MKSVKRHFILFVFALFFPAAFIQTALAQSVLSPQDKKIVAEFEKRAKEYVKLRARLERRLPKLSKDAKPEQIEAHKMALQKSVQAARISTKKGEIFTPAGEQLIRKIIKNEFKGQERLELRQTVLEADTKGVPLKVNVPYPETKEQIEMPPELLLSLPQLPQQLRFRFVGRSLLLVDRANELILDYMTNALP